MKLNRKAEVRARANEPSYRYHSCRVMGCGKPSRAATQDGLDTFFCRAHADHHSRHGSPYKSSYRSRDLAPHRKTARAWLKDYDADPWVKNALVRVEGLYRSGGPHVEAFRLRGLSPQERAKAAWARLRKAKVDPRRVVEASLAVELTVLTPSRTASQSTSGSSWPNKSTSYLQGRTRNGQRARAARLRCMSILVREAKSFGILVLTSRTPSNYSLNIISSRNDRSLLSKGKPTNKRHCRDPNAHDCY